MDLLKICDDEHLRSLPSDAWDIKELEPTFQYGDCDTHSMEGSYTIHPLSV
jgi:hypothetical protein